MKHLLKLIVITSIIPLSALANGLSLFHQIKTSTLDGQAFDFINLKGKAVLIVNTASKCGFTPQLSNLEELNKKYHSKGLVILAVPSNDFKQEHSNTSDIKNVASEKYKTSFLFLEKQSITGENKSPLFKYLTEKKKNLIFKEVQWNFEKFLIDKNGEVVDRWSSMTKPTSKSITEKIEFVLK